MKKVCKKCRLIVDSGNCPICGNSDFSNSWKGRLIIISPEESDVAKKIDVSKEGNYALKIR